MANKIIIHTSAEVIIDTTVGTHGGNTYTTTSLDKNADSRSWGGKYELSTVYTDDDVCHWKGVVVTATTADALNNSGWTTASGVDNGTIPNSVYLYCVDFVKSIGTATQVNLTIGGVIYAQLTAGESVCIPCHASDTITDVKIHANNYNAGTNEATVNVMLAGQ